MIEAMSRAHLDALLYLESTVSRPRRLAQAVDWHAETEWQPELNLNARSWERWSLFSVRPAPGARPIERIRARERVDSPTSRFRYVERVLPAGVAIATYSGSRLGTVMFDGDVVVPCLYECGRGTAPWMSLTPMEVMTLRPGTRLAAGHTVVAGLGLGWQLAQVIAVGKATRITLVERDQELVDWILPRVRSQVASAASVPLDVIVGDAREVVPALAADVALIDIFPSYGDNLFPPCPRIGRVWCWGR